MLSEPDVSTQTQVLYINAIPPNIFKMDVSYNLLQKLKALSTSDNAEVKAAATRMLNEGS